MFDSYYVREACSIFDTVIVNEKLGYVLIFDPARGVNVKAENNEDLKRIVLDYCLPFC